MHEIPNTLDIFSGILFPLMSKISLSIKFQQTEYCYAMMVLHDPHMNEMLIHAICSALYNIGHY